MTGNTAWHGHAALSRPLTIMGVERRWFLLSLTLSLATWNAVNSLITGAFIFATLYFAGWWAWRKDPQMLFIISASAASCVRYDPGKPSSWHLDVLE